MAYGLKYRNNFEGINDLTNVKYNVLLEIFQDGYAGAVTEIEELDKNPLQFRLDNSGDTHFVPIKKTSVSINIVDTGQFDYSEFYTSNAKKYKVVITSPVLNWKGYLVPQSYNSNLNYRQPFTLTASDGLHLLSSIDYVPDQSKTVTLAGFIADIESRIGLGTFDRTTTIQTEIGNVWDALIYEGMFTDLNYEEALEMVLKSIGMQLRYWKIFPVIESYNVTNNAGVQIINKDISLSFLAPIKTAKVTQEITTLPDLMLNGMVDDLSDLAESNVGHVLPFDTLSKWVADPTAGGVIVNRGRSRSTSDRDTSDYYTAINLELIPVNGVKESFELTGNEISYFVCRPVNATALTFSIKANFGKVAYFSGRGSTSGLVNSKLYPAKYVELKYGIYDEISNKSFNYTTMYWDITGRPTQANCNKLRITYPKDGDTTIYIETPATTGATTKVNFYLLGGSVEYVDTMLPAVAQTMVKNILSIDAIEVDGVSLVSDKELYNETSSVVDVAPNIDVLDYDISFGYCPSPPANTSLYYGSAFYHTNLAQIVNVVVQGNTIPWLQYIYQTLLYTQNVQRKKVYTCSLLLKSVVNPIWLRTTLMGDVVMTNSLTFDWKTSQISAELTEIMPYVYSAWTITSESTIGSSDWGGSGGTSGSVGGGGSSVDLSNCVVKTGATSQDIEGDISADNMVSRGAVVAGALNATLPDDLPVSSPLLYGVSKYDDVTIKINASGQWYVATSGGTVVSFGTEITGQSIQLIVAGVNKTLALAGHTHNYQPLDGDLTAIAALTGTGLLKRTGTDTWTFDTNAYLTAITKAMVEGVLTGIITSHQHNYLPINGGNLTGPLTILTNTVYHAGNIPTWNQSTTGNAATATKLSSARTFALTGDVTGTITSDLASGFSIATTIAANSVALGTDTTGNYTASVGVSGNGLSLTGTVGEGVTFTVNSNATANNNASTIMFRDATGSYMATNGIHTGAVVAGALNGTLPDDLPVATSLLYGTIKFDPTTLALNGSNQLTVIGGGGGSNVAWGTATSQYTPLMVDSVTRNLSLDGHTHSYLQLSGGTLTGSLIIEGYGLYESLILGYSEGYNLRLHNSMFVSDNGNRNAGFSLYNVDVPLGSISITSTDIYYTNSSNVNNTIWHAGNDGAGSGLDADMLDGIGLGLIVPSSGERNYPNGTLVTTSIDYSVSNGSPFYLEIKGNTYGRWFSCFTQAQGYIFSDTITNYSVTHLGYASIDGLIAINVGGNLCFWFPNQSYWEGYSILVTDATDSVFNRVTNIVDSVKPVGTKEVALNGRTIKSAFTDSNVASATKLANTRYLWGNAFTGEGDVTGRITFSNYDSHITMPIGYIGCNTYDSYFWNASNHPIKFGTNDLERMRIAPTGNVLIGTSTDSGYELDVNGTFRTTGAAYLNSTLTVTGVSTLTGLLTANGGIGGTTGAFSSYLTANRFYTGYDSGIANSFSCSNWFRSNGATGWLNDTYSAGILSDTANIVRTYNTNKFKVFNTEANSIYTLGGIIAQSVGSDYNTAAFQALGNGSANTVFPTIGFHQPGLYASSIQLRSAGNFYFYKQGASVYANITAQAGTFSSDVHSEGFISATGRIFTGYDSGIVGSVSASNWFRSNGATGWLNATYTAGILSDTANIVRTYSTNKFKVYNTAIDSILTLGGVTAANVISSGAVVAGALNGTLPDDLPIATGSLFGVIKAGVSLFNNAGLINLNGRHYTTTSTYTDAAVREITSELVLGTGNMTSGTLDQIQLAFAPLATTRGLTGNIIATASGAGMSLTIGFRKDTGSGRWYLMIYNGTGATVVRDGILISIRGQQKI